MSANVNDTCMNKMIPTARMNVYRSRRKSRAPFGALMLFVCGLLSATQIQLIGYLSIVEIIFAVLTPYYVVTCWDELRRSSLWPFLLLIFGWFVSAAITDIYRETELMLALKGVSTPILWASAFVSMYFLLRERVDLMRWFILGAAISGVVSLYIFKPGSLIGLQQKMGWTFEYNYRILIIVITTFVWAAVLFLYPRFRTLVLGILVGFALLSFLEGSRSMGAIALLAALMLAFRRQLFGASARVRKNHGEGRILKLAVIGLVAIISISEGYRYAVLDGWFGRVEMKRYLNQSKSAIGIMSARSEFASALFAIADSPIIGHGSWARDEAGYHRMGTEALEMDASLVRDTSKSLIPSHSHLWGAWVSHGFLGFVFWFYMLVFVVKFLLDDLPYTTKYLPFLLLLGIGALWNIIFSPVAHRPLAAAGYCFMLILSEAVARRRLKE